MDQCITDIGNSSAIITIDNPIFPTYNELLVLDVANTIEITARSFSLSFFGINEVGILNMHIDFDNVRVSPTRKSKLRQMRLFISEC